MSDIRASLISRAWRRVDIKLTIDGDMHILRWRRGWFVDEVLFDDRRVATTSGLFGRETIYGLNVKMDEAAHTRLLLSVDVSDDWTDWNGSGRPAGVRLETADAAVLAIGSLNRERSEGFKQLFDRAIEAVGLS